MVARALVGSDASPSPIHPTVAAVSAALLCTRCNNDLALRERELAGRMPAYFRMPDELSARLDRYLRAARAEPIGPDGQVCPSVAPVSSRAGELRGGRGAAVEVRQPLVDWHVAVVLRGVEHADHLGDRGALSGEAVPVSVPTGRGKNPTRTNTACRRIDRRDY
jgi:hypothetical protein